MSEIKIRLDRTRMAMAGEYYSYDVSVPTSEVDSSKHSSFIIRDGQEYVSFVDATLPVEHQEMPKGWERYAAFLAHQKIAEQRAWEILKANFPELSTSAQSSLFFPIPGFDASHETKIITAEVR